MLRKMGLFSVFAFASASSSHGFQLTGLSACWSRYGEVEVESLFMNRYYWGSTFAKVIIPEEGKISDDDGYNFGE